MILAAPALPANAQDQEPATGGALFTAQQEAVAEGKTVQVDTLTTQTTTVAANPDGTFTSTTSLMPVRVQKDGEWVAVDATLGRNGDGTWSPKASPHAVALSGGGSGPVVRLTHEDGSEFALTMPFPLPAPQVSGDTALYPAVLPGVDLSVSVTDQGGFSDILIVHDAAAAADPRVRELKLTAATDGLTLHATPSGGMEAKTADGTLDYVSARPVMWDSATPDAAATAPATNTRTTAASRLAPATGSVALAAPAVAVPVASLADTPADEATASSVDGPGPGAIVDQVPMTTTQDAVTLRPDTSVLTDPDTVYPVYIDPYTNPVSSKSGHFTEVYSSSACSDSPQYDKPQSNGEGVGYQRWGGACGTGLERSYYAINSSGLNPAMVVSKAIITVASTYAASWDCSKDQPITLHSTGPINSGTDWNSKPATYDSTYAAVKTTIPSAANSGSSCSNHTASFTVTGQAQKIADSGTDWWTVGLFGDESISSGNDNYLRMSTVLTLTTTFDIPPNTPGSLHTTPAATGASGACVTSGVGWIGATSYSAAGSNLQLHATVTTNVSGELASAVYDFWDRTVLSGGNPTTVATPSSPYVASGTDADVPVGVTLKDGHEYGWDVYAKDNAAAHLTSPVSPHCWFRTDFSPPETPDIAANPSFPQVGGGAGDPLVYAGPGHTTEFDVSAGDRAPAATCTPGPCLMSGVDHFVWRLDAQPTAQAGTSVPVGGTNGSGDATAKLTVPVTAWGVHTLYVAAVDKAGNLSQSPVGYTYTVPWNPATKITPGDISGDGVPDLLATTRTGDLVLLPGNTDAAQPVAPAQTAPQTEPTAPAAGPATVSTAAQSPDGTGWNNYLIAHRGNLHGSDVDDLFAYNKQTHQLYIVKNDLDPAADDAFPRQPYSTYAGFMGKRFDVVPKDACEPVERVADDARCRTAGYNSTSWNLEQLVTPGNPYGNTTNYPAVITVEGKKLWIYQTDGGGHFKHPLLLGDGDWSGFTLLGPGTVGGTLTTGDDGKGSVTGGSPVLWARDDSSGSVLSFPITVDPDTLVPALLHAPVDTALTSAVAAAGGGKLCLDVYQAHTANGTKVQTWACNGTRAQTWTLMSDGSLRALGSCLDVNGGGTANGTLVQLWSCNGGGSQKWTLGASGSLVNPQSGKCLDDPNGSNTPGAQPQIYTCNGTAAQNWTTGAAAGWQTNSPTALSPVLWSGQYPSVMSPGDLNSPAGGPDGHPELYAVDSAGQLIEYAGAAPTGTMAAFTAPASLGAVGNTATHEWRLDEGAGSTVADDPGALDAALTGAYAWNTDAGRGKVLNLSGTTGYAATTGPAVDTSGSFTVSAWVKLGSATGNSTFVSQSDGAGNANGFQLYYSSGAKVWAFGRHHDDTASPAFSAAYGAPAVVGKWTHLVGVYDAAADQLLLYVDGKLSATKAYAGTTWNADGGVQIGRRLYQSAYGEYANGSVSDVRVFPTALPAANAAATGSLPGITQLD
ncbi:ricin-type beta-trefoil lectin domain protein [Streptomyces sp. NBC_00322]|uniref:ricin-type beta-trefoil lectin domain protein n=1 Tax=Streptomyces sp. NBC_00322 TaxID=2975712 RepID=UPI002E29F140|nr:ricin-type beta-trefoil lectin domain protein [Streptomyces sp. NBC_00322]